MTWSAAFIGAELFPEPLGVSYVDRHLDHARRNRRHDSLDERQDLRATAELTAMPDDSKEE